MSPILAAVASGCGLSSGRAMAAEDEASFTVVVLPDTQYYASAHPEILEAQAQWIVRRRKSDRIAFVVHEGDIVDADETRQWESAARSLHELDGVVPYVLSAGNHDYRRQGSVISRETSINAYFPVARFAATSWFKGTFAPGHIENSFELVDTPAGPWLILSLEFGPRDTVLAWADQIARRYRETPTILVTHAYLYSDDTRYDHVARPDQLWNPHGYFPEDTAGQVNDGEEIWRKLVSVNDNILFVVCGHDLADGVGRLTSARPDGTTVHQLLANYQTGALGGEGFLRLMRFFPDQRKVAVRTYSPYADRFKTEPDNQFTLDY
ncbi:MAG TPA: metallophosphoesterase [Polyangia bacterium]|nr:metallophosphoesterase [Polyangia bacterium]